MGGLGSVGHVLLGAVNVNVPGKRPPELFDWALKSVQFSQGKFKVSSE